MAKMMKIPILGIVQNMSYFVCEKCGAKHYVYGKSDIAETAAKFGIKNTAEIPIIPDAAKKCDEGKISELELPEIEKFFSEVASK
jgi:Mrp family chromosome partitioning ATPase